MNPQKVALVTGASKGIGYQTCDLLLRHGLKVYGLSRTKPNFENTAFVWLQADLSKEESLIAATHNIQESQLDLFVSNAAAAFEEPATAVTQKSFGSMFTVNVLAPMLLVRELQNKLPVATIVNVSSVSDRLAEKEYALYGSSKAASTLYFETLALELRGSKVYSLLPSYVDTPMLRQLEQGRQFDWNKTLQSWQIATLIYKLYKQEIALASGSNIIVVNNALETGAKSNERLYEYNVETLRLSERSN